MTSAQVYSLDKLMAQTRLLAADYYKATQQTLPVSSELANYDAMRLLALSPPPSPMRGVDAVFQDKKIQIKARVLFKEDRQGYRLGQVQPDGLWDVLVLVLFNPEYEPDFAKIKYFPDCLCSRILGANLRRFAFMRAAAYGEATIGEM